jgi:hypothetical protein
LCKTTLFGIICATIVQPLFRVEHPENDHHNENFPIGLFDATSTKNTFFTQVGHFRIARQSLPISGKVPAPMEEVPLDTARSSSPRGIWAIS